MACGQACTGLLTGDNRLHDGLDIAPEGRAALVSDESMLGRVAQAYLTKYGEDWRHVVRNAGSCTRRSPSVAMMRGRC
jgi:hypothetical protein